MTILTTKNVVKIINPIMSDKTVKIMINNT